MVLVEANLVTPSDNGNVPVVEGQAVVEQSAADRKRKQRRRFAWMFGLVLLAVGIAVGVTLGITLNRQAPSSASPSMHPTIRQFQDSLPQSTVSLMQDPRAPQYLAWEWLTASDDYLNWDLWKLRQRFALACFRFATTAFESYIVDPFHPFAVDECNWTGIVCNNMSGRVIQLELQDRSLEGSLPQELYFLSDLSRLNLAGYSKDSSGNDLSGSISTHLGNLSSSLKWLNLRGNWFTGALPSELGELTLLEHLDLSDNYRMTFRVPTELGLLSLLTFMDMTGSSTGSIPTEIGQLTRLESLYLGGGKGTVPTELGQLSQLKNLELTVQLVAGRFPTELGQLPLLESLEIRCRLNGTIPAEVGLMSRLTDLVISGATGTIPTTLGQLTVLESLDLSLPSANRLTGTIPTQLGRLTELKYLGLGDNSLNGTIPTELGRLAKLTELDMHDNPLTGTIPTELGLLSKLEAVNLYTLITGHVPSKICQLALFFGVLDDIAIDCILVNCTCGCRCVCYTCPYNPPARRLT